MDIQSPQVMTPGISNATASNAGSNAGKELQQKSLTAAEIQSWIVTYLADLLDIEPDEVNPSIPFDRYGLDSATAVGLTGDLEDWMGKKLDPTLLYDYPTVETFAQHLAEEFNSAA